jgi:4-amino-4-deoxy-L-arabinose transferase-like glycosyltransferase
MFFSIDLLSVSLALILPIIPLCFVFLRRKIRWNFDLDLPEKERFIILIISLVFLVMLIHNYLVPIDNYDSLTYHLPLAKKIFIEKSLPEYASPSYSEVNYAYPPAIFLFYASTYVANGGVTLIFPKLLPWLFGLLCILLVYKISRLMERDRKESLISILLCLATPAIIYLIVNENTDIYFAFFFLSSLYFLLLFFRERSSRYLYLASVMLALSYWTKYFGLVAILSVFLAIIYFKVSRKTDISLREIAVFVIITGLIIAPHLVRNFIVLGNPVYPYLGNILGGEMINDWSLRYVSSFYSPTIFNIVSLKAFFSVEYALAIILLISFLFYRKNDSEKFVLFCSAAYFAIAFIFLNSERSNFARIILSPLILFSLLGARVFNDMLKGNQKRVFFATLAIAVLYLSYELYAALYQKQMDLEKLYIFLKYFTIIFGLVLMSVLMLIAKKKNIGWLIIAVIFLPSLFMISGGFADAFLVKKDFLADVSPKFVSGGEWMAQNLPQNSKILTFEGRIYLFPKSTFPADSPLLERIYENITIKEAVGILKHYNITHVYPLGGEEHPLYNLSVAYNSLNDTDYFTLLYSDDSGARIYALK